MTKTISAIDLHYITQELQVLIGGRVDKIYVPRKKEIILELFVRSKGKFFLQIDENSVYLTEQKPSTTQPTDFCMFLRKKLNRAIIKSIDQIDFERILSITLETKTSKFKIIAEIFSKGNILLIKNNKILVASEYQNWKDRTIRPNTIYKHPKKDYNFLKLKQEELNTLLKQTNKENIVKTLAVELGLGGVYSEEVCLLSKIDKNKDPKSLTDKELKLLFSALEKIKTQKLNPQTIYKNKEILDLTPFQLKIYEKNKQEKAESFSKILNSYFSNIDEIKEKEQRNKKVNQIKEIIENQKEDIKKLEKQEKINHEKAEILYNNYQQISQILQELKKISKEHSWTEIKEKLKGHKLIKEVISKDKSIIVEIKQ